MKWITYEVVPQVLSQLLSFILYTFEVNVRAGCCIGIKLAPLASIFFMNGHFGF